MAVTTTIPPAPPTPVPPVPQCFVSPTAHLIIEPATTPAGFAWANMDPALVPWQALAILKQLYPIASGNLIIVPLPQAAVIIRQLAAAAIRLQGYRG